MRRAWINWRRYVPALYFKTTGQLAVGRAKLPLLQTASSFPPLAGYATKSNKVKRRKKKEVSCSDAQVEDNNKPPRTSYPFLGQFHSIKPPVAELNENTYKQEKSQHTNFNDLYSSNNENCPTAAPDTYINKEDSRDGRYYVFRSPSQEKYKLPSVTTILRDTMPRNSWFGLHNWRQSMIQEYGEKGYQEWRQEVIQSGKKFHKLLEDKLQDRHPNTPSSTYNARRRKRGDVTYKLQPIHHVSNGTINKTTSNTISNSNNIEVQSSFTTSSSELSYQDEWSMLHSLDQGFSSLRSSLSPTNTVSYEELYKNYRYWESIQSVLDQISEVMVTEGVIKHDELGYSGTVDCIAKYRDQLHVIDWKTSIKPKPTLDDLYDYPLQTVAYAGAINNDSRYPFKVENVLIAVVYPTGAQAHTHILDSTQCHYYWEKWIDRLDQYKTQFAHDLTDIVT